MIGGKPRRLREHGRLIVGLAARALFFIAARFALEVVDLLFDGGQFDGARNFGLQSRNSPCRMTRSASLYRILTFLRPPPLVILLKTAHSLLQDRNGPRAAERFAFRLLGFDVALYVSEPRRGQAPVFHHAAAIFGGKADGRRQREGDEGEKHRHAESDREKTPLAIGPENECWEAKR